MNHKKQVDWLIEYFNNERDLLYNRYRQHDDHQKFSFTSGIGLFSLIAIVIVAFIDKFTLIKEIISVIMYSLMGLFIIILYSIFHLVYFSWKNEKEYFAQIIRLDIIIDFLWHFKITEEKLDLSPIIEKLKLDNRGYWGYDKGSRNRRLDSIIHSIDEINNIIIKNENSKIQTN